MSANREFVAEVYIASSDAQHNTAMAHIAIAHPDIYLEAMAYLFHASAADAQWQADRDAAVAREVIRLLDPMGWDL